MLIPIKLYSKISLQCYNGLIHTLKWSKLTGSRIPFFQKNAHTQKYTKLNYYDCLDNVFCTLVLMPRYQHGFNCKYFFYSLSYQVDAATNTDSEACFENRINEIQKNLDGIFTAVDKRKSVVNDARTQIDELRCKAISRAATAAATKIQNAGNQKNVDPNRNTVSDNSIQTTWASRLFLPVGYPTQDNVNNYPPNYASDLTDIDPAILSVRTTRTDHSMNGHFYPLSML